MKKDQIKYEHLGISTAQRKTSKFLKLLSNPNVIRVLQKLHTGKKTYSEIMLLFTSGHKSVTAFYIRHLREHQCITLRDGYYSITWKGIKAYEYYTMADEISNLDMSSYDPGKAETHINIHNSESWLKPYLEDIIHDITGKQNK